MADNLIEQLVEHINAMVVLINQAQPTVNGFIQVQLRARGVFAFFNGINPDQLPNETFAYIEAYRTLDQQVIEVQQAIQQHLDQVNQMPYQNQELPNQEAKRYNRLIDGVVNRLHRIENQRDRTRQFLLDCEYATEEQLEQGYDGQTPWRFMWKDNPEAVAWPMVNTALSYIDEILDPLVEEAPAVWQFTELPDMAHRSLAKCREFMRLIHAGIPLELYQQMVPANYFNYINLFQERNENFREDEDIIEDKLELIERIANEMPEVVNQEQLELFQDLRKRFRQIQRARDEVKAYLLDEDFASEDQLKLGYNGVIPDAFRLEGVLF